MAEEITERPTSFPRLGPGGMPIPTRGEGISMGGANFDVRLEFVLGERTLGSERDEAPELRPPRSIWPKPNWAWASAAKVRLSPIANKENRFVNL